jgi:hypothetical protein
MNSIAMFAYLSMMAAAALGQSENVADRVRSLDK